MPATTATTETARLLAAAEERAALLEAALRDASGFVGSRRSSSSSSFFGGGGGRAAAARALASLFPPEGSSAADWSNLPMRPSFLPLLQRLSVYLASTVFPPRNLDVGKPLVAFLPVSQAGKTAALVTPDGVALEIPIIKKGERGVVEFAATQRPGLYVLTPPGGPPLHYVVNTSRRESDLERLTDSEIHGFAKAHGVSLVRSGAEYRKLDHTRRFGMEIWRAILWVILVLLFLEIFLQQKFSRARRAPANPGRKL